MVRGPNPTPMALVLVCSTDVTGAMAYFTYKEMTIVITLLPLLIDNVSNDHINMIIAGNANRGWWGILKYPLKILGKFFEKNQEKRRNLG